MSGVNSVGKRCESNSKSMQIYTDKRLLSTKAQNTKPAIMYTCIINFYTIYRKIWYIIQFIVPTPTLSSITAL